MLIQFTFKNYKSFRDDTILDLSATKITEFSDRVVKVGKEKLLPTAAIYGANASGKSNVIEAFRFMNAYVVKSFDFGGEGDRDDNETKILKRTPFLFDKNSKNDVSSFEVFFMVPGDTTFKTYNYGFTLNDEGVKEEWLNVKAKSSKEYKRIFYREDDDLEMVGIQAKRQENIRISLQKETLVVSLGAKLKIEKLTMVRDWFLDAIFTNFGDPFENVFLSRQIPINFADDKKVQNDVVKYFSAFDPSIIGFDVEPIKGDDNKEDSLRIYAKHKVAGTKRTERIPLHEESDGTLKMFALYPALHRTLDRGGVLCVDELNARLHPLLVRNVVIMFLNPKINTKHAQLIFTTHDAWQMSSDYLRRDEIWFTEKDADGVTSLYSLADFEDDGVKIRKDESFEKNYMLGKYGAVPELKSFDML